MRIHTLPFAGCCLLAAMTAAADPTPAPASAAQVAPGQLSATDLKRAYQILRAWEETAPQKEVRKLRVCYWTPADRDPLPACQERLTRVMQSIQNFYAKELARRGFPGRSIRLELNPQNLLDLVQVKGTLRDAQCNEEDGAVGQAIRNDCLQALKTRGIDGDHETLLIFCNLTDWDPVKRRMSHHSPYYGSGNSACGTAWQLDSPLLDAASLPVKDQFLDDKQYGHISLGRYNSIFIGGVCHELGHALGLPHCKESVGERPALGADLMGDGNRTYGEELRGEGKGSFICDAHALKLAAHPQFSGSVKQMDAPASVDFDGWRFESRADGLRVSARVRAGLPALAVIGYADPAGGGDYDSEVAVGTPDADGRFSLLLPHPEGKHAGAVELHFVTVCANGAATSAASSENGRNFGARMDADGRLDARGTQAVLDWEPVAQAWRAGELPADGAARAKLTPDQREILRRLELPDNAHGKPAPQAVPAARKTIALADCAPTRAATGWEGVHYDRTCEGQALIGPDGPAKSGLWAHADAEHAYNLDGAWKRFTGSCGLLAGGRSESELDFSIWADGKKIWTADTGGGAFDLDVTQVKELVLRSEAKNKGGAWGGWLEPTLTR